MRVIFASLHHRRSLLFEEGLSLISSQYPVYIKDTGGLIDNGWGNFGLEGSKIHYYSAGMNQISYDLGLMTMKDILVGEWDIIHFLDNDCFISDTAYIKQTIDEFAKSDLGFCSYFENGSSYDGYTFTGTIAEVTNQRFEKTSEYPYIKPVPHWENTMMMFKRETWDALTKDDLSNGRLCIKALVDKGFKLGTKKRESRLTYSHKGDGWFHVGNLMAYYYMVEDLNLSRLKKDSQIDLARIGYFIYQQERFKSDIYDKRIRDNLEIITQALGKDRCLKAWYELYS